MYLKLFYYNQILIFAKARELIQADCSNSCESYLKCNHIYIVLFTKTVFTFYKQNAVKRILHLQLFVFFVV